MVRIDFHKIVTRTFMIILLTGFTFANGAAMPLPGDTAKFPRRFWLSVGLGPESFGSGIGGTLNLEISHKWFISADVIDEENSRDIYSDLTAIEVYSYSIMAGKIYEPKLRHTFATWAAGLGLVNVVTTEYVGVYPTAMFVDKNKYTLGIPFKVQVYIVALHTVGVGINVYGNLNLLQTTAGIQLSLAIGRLFISERKSASK